ncbi:MAG: hypothetical protein V6Z89_25155 [Desulfobacter sp.]
MRFTDNRSKPSIPPKFPGKQKVQAEPIFPGKNKSSINRQVMQESNKLEIEIRINQDFDSFTTYEQMKFLNGLKELLHINYDIKISKVSLGSVLVRVLLNERDSLKIFVLSHIGKIPNKKIIDVNILTPFEISIHEAIRRLALLEPIPAVPGRKETGTVVYANKKLGYGIVERDLGGYLTFNIGADEKIIIPDAQVKYDISSDDVDDFYKRSPDKLI